ncbi:TetR/AcrR family transcriptional regulator [Lentilactobacillus sp. SPB1-3]|uniref:TetR/AcrR family transcriptional regulator n=1 Tax=Lentilactobacillus terminaliae TaxID=3003483 RepID=A0ACD5DDM6_9LACO|nr:TetR/AcrR family transcriptional regulator [Lentilactobacillus sp. SPB1-3]MCZ0977689.1 TetR/AcrR family transcriptional regulator [Lentilactobacillus sp. SPB1-3]
MKPKNEAVRQQIIDAATELIIEYGIAGTSTVKVAKRINGAQSNIYSYFKSKSELISGVFLHHQKMMINAMKPAFDESKSPKKLVADIVSELLSFADEDPTSIQIIAAFRAQPNLRQQLPTIDDSQLLTKMFELITNYQRDRVINSAPAEFIAEAIFSIVVNYSNAKLADENYAPLLSKDTVIKMVSDFTFIDN